MSDSGVIKKLNRGKKRQVNVDEWKDVHRKKSRDSGREYFSRNGRKTSAKIPPSELPTCKCYFECSKLTLEMMKGEFEKFYLMNYNEQTAYLASMMELCDPVLKKGTVGRRLVSIKYSFLDKGAKMRVCQKTIIKTYQVTARRLQIIYEKLKLGNNEDLKDKRGKHLNRPHRVKESEIILIRDHINSFPVEESHYSRHKSTKMCLSAELSIRRMHFLYLQKYPESQLKYFTYRKTFVNDFNLRFGSPRSDTCKYCDRLFLKLSTCEDEIEQKKIQQEAELHHRKAEKAYNTLHNDQINSNENNIVICVDLQQVIYTPNLTHSDVFYKRQYANYNFCIKDFSQNTSNMHLWHESIAGRGSMEIASCILTYCKENFSQLQGGQLRNLTIWSDRCVGQNNNWTMIVLFFILIKSSYFTQINQKFMVTGHSFLPCDRDFSNIERKKKITKTLYTPNDIENLIKTAKENPHPFNVKKMDQNNFFNFTNVLDNISKPKNFKITEARWIQICGDDPTTIKVRKSHNIMEAWENLKFLKKKLNINLPLKFNGPINIKKEKLKDLKELAEYLPPNAKIFYDNLV